MKAVSGLTKCWLQPKFYEIWRLPSESLLDRISRFLDCIRRFTSEISECIHREKHRNFTRFPGVKILRKGTVSAYAEIVPFHKVSTPGNQLKLRCFLQWFQILQKIYSKKFTFHTVFAFWKRSDFRDVREWYFAVKIAVEIFRLVRT